LIGIDSPDTSKAVLPPLSIQIQQPPILESKPETETITTTQPSTNTKSNSSDVVVIKMNELAQA